MLKQRTMILVCAFRLFNLPSKLQYTFIVKSNYLHPNCLQSFPIIVYYSFHCYSRSSRFAISHNGASTLPTVTPVEVTLFFSISNTIKYIRLINNRTQRFFAGLCGRIFNSYSFHLPPLVALQNKLFSTVRLVGLFDLEQTLQSAHHCSTKGTSL